VNLRLRKGILAIIGPILIVLELISFVVPPRWVDGIYAWINQTGADSSTANLVMVPLGAIIGLFLGTAIVVKLCVIAAGLLLTRIWTFEKPAIAGR